MKNSIVGKTLIILSSIIVILFVLVAYLFMQSDNMLIEKIRLYNYNSAMKTLDNMQEQQLRTAKQKLKTTLSAIAKSAAIFIYNYDKDGLKDNIKIFMEDNSIKGIEVWDGRTNELFLSILKINNKITIATNTPKTFSKYQKLNKTIVVKDMDTTQNIGKVVVYYDDTIIRNRIMKLRNKTKNDILSILKNSSQNQKILLIIIAKFAEKLWQQLLKVILFI